MLRNLRSYLLVALLIALYALSKFTKITDGLEKYYEMAEEAEKNANKAEYIPEPNHPKSSHHGGSHKHGSSSSPGVADPYDFSKSKWLPSKTNCAAPPTGMIFLKKHKTASTTFRHMLTKYARFKGLPSVGEPQLIGPQGGCYPARFDERCWPATGHMSPIVALTYHFRWNMDLFEEKFLTSGVASVTTIRDPETTFRSVYNYYYLNHAGKVSKCDMPCWGEPFRSFNNGREDLPVGEFLDNLPKLFNASETRNFRSKNYQAFEMGMDHLNDNTAYILRNLKRLDQHNFDFVVLTEYYYESLVLLAKLFCLPYEVLYEPQLNKREYEIEPLTPTQKKNFETYFKADIMLYDYFNKSLHHKIEDYGREKFHQEVEKLKAVYEKCEEDVKHCLWKKAPRMNPEDLKITAVPGEKMKVQDFIDLMDENFGWCSNPFNPYTQLKLWQKTGKMTYGDECNYKQDILNNFEL
ncbi:Oidioi.mRNA.OKI2018_I69.chr2.g7138.t1.cds [Oikopleura dioica]|uniref:Oidioi.mRNA.OKI2018_I69.chr2.g7138.t1.cds n=1 Tax=Oikopleura dioica TaxID=34765 RepID=A0ABN7T574_OIKDI|nr:Oidioi.mRNA.OKI2018_I69.chr2.g7138.t1.cds [Oikopleura dioica]